MQSNGVAPNHCASSAGAKRQLFYAQSIESLELPAIDAQRIVASKLKRSMDILLSLVALGFFLPLLLMIAFAVRLESHGPSIFRQIRGGLSGTTFVILKFRTMRVEAETASTQQAVRGDPRVTRVGAFLRRSSLDELPQLFNVLKGEMSIVGPRPHAADHDEYYGNLFPQYALRFAVRPGLTGLAQVEGYRGETAHAHQMAQRINCDIEYIRTWTIWSDVKLIMRSALVPFLTRAY